MWQSQLSHKSTCLWLTVSSIRVGVVMNGFIFVWWSLFTYLSCVKVGTNKWNNINEIYKNLPHPNKQFQSLKPLFTHYSRITTKRNYSFTAQEIYINHMKVRTLNVYIHLLSWKNIIQKYVRTQLLLIYNL